MNRREMSYCTYLLVFHFPSKSWYDAACIVLRSQNRLIRTIAVMLLLDKPCRRVIASGPSEEVAFTGMRLIVPATIMPLTSFRHS